MDDSFELDFAALKAAQPRWLADTLGVRGNAVESHREQAQIEWPASGINHRGMGDPPPTAQAGSPEQPPSVHAT